MRIHSIKTWWALAGLLILPALALSLAAQRSNSLITAGHGGDARITRVDGRTSGEGEALARPTNSPISLKGKKFVLPLPGPAADAPPPAAPAMGFSKDFVIAGI